VNFKIFRAYDVRGIYPDEINEDVCYRIAKGYVYLYKPNTMVVGMDARPSSPSLKEALVAGFVDAGINVIDIGKITTDMLYFAVAAYNYSGGIVVSASHNPKQYNGLKLVRENAAAISSDTGLFDIRDALKQSKDLGVQAASKGSYSQKEILADYLTHVLCFVEKENIHKFSFVGNTNFGYGSIPIRELAKMLDLNLVPLNFEPDGSFPKGPPDPMLPANRVETERLISKSNADLGVAWDGDADRVFFFDENRTFISGVYVTALLAEIMLNKFGSNNKIIFDPRVIWPVLAVLGRTGGEPIISKGGHAFMKDRMRKENALFAGEMSGHYYFRENFYADNGVIPFLLILEQLSRSGKPFSEMMRPYMEGHYMSGELNYRVKDINEVIAQVKARFSSEGKEDFTDGYSLDTADWRFNIRPSNTEPLLRLNLEAHKPGLIESVQAEIESIIGSKPH